MKGLLLTFQLFCAADAATTHYTLATGRGYEVVLPTQNPWVADAIIAGEAVAGTWGVKKLEQHHHQRVARIVAWSLVGIRIAAVAHNLHELSR